MAKKLRIDMVSDYACPWCYVGKHRLETALTQVSDMDVEIRFLPFQLNPDMPREGRDRKEHMATIFGDDKVDDILNNKNGIGVEEGLTIRYVEGSKSPNTLSAHVVSHLASQQGKQSEFSEKVFEAYFSYGKNIGDPEVLHQLAEEAGLETYGLAETISSGDGESDIQQQVEEYRAKGVSGVPFFIVNSQYGISGAQPVETLVSAFRQISEE